MCHCPLHPQPAVILALWCVKSHLYITFYHVPAACATISKLCMVMVISRVTGELRGCISASLLHGLMVFNFYTRFHALEGQTSQLQPGRPDRHLCPTSADYVVCVHAAFQRQGMLYWGARGRCSFSVRGHTHGQPSGMPQVSNLPTVSHAAGTHAWESLRTAVSPPTF